MQDDLFERSFANVVVQRSTGHLQKHREFAPVFFHIRDCLTEPRVRLYFTLLQLVLEPSFEVIHWRPTFRLVKAQALVGRHPLLTRKRVGSVNLGQSFKQVAAFLRKLPHHIDKLPATVGQAVSQHNLELAGEVV